MLSAPGAIAAGEATVPAAFDVTDTGRVRRPRARSTCLGHRLKTPLIVELGAVDLRAERRGGQAFRRHVGRREANLRCTPGRAPLALRWSRRGTSGPCSVWPAAVSTITQVASGVAPPCTRRPGSGDLPGAATTSGPRAEGRRRARSSAFTIAAQGPRTRPGRLVRRQLRSGRSEDPDARSRIVVRVDATL